MTHRPETYRRYENDAVFDGLEALERAAGERGVSVAGLALAWLLATPEVTAVVVGPTCVEHLGPVREALELDLSAADRDDLRGLLP
jgi:aryl-alcohol dehydrogenase-like predicted oxidoreductase